jgi:hypothetical protein
MAKQKEHPPRIIQLAPSNGALVLFTDGTTEPVRFFGLLDNGDVAPLVYCTPWFEDLREIDTFSDVIWPEGGQHE